MLGFLYSLVIVITLIGYLPQLHKLWLAQSDCRDISISTWAIWKFTAIVSLAYGYYELADFKFCATAAINLICITAVIALTVTKRLQYAKA